MQKEEKERIEIQYWKNHPYENPNNFTPNNIVHKLIEAKIFLDKIDNKYEDIFKSADRILELGAGQGWASCIIKSKFPNKEVLTSDISEYAIQSLHYWEELFKTKIDKTLVCKSYQIPVKDNSLDLIFTFQSFHHFGRYKKTLEEIHRVLKNGGVCMLLNEPSCSDFIYPLAYKRVNMKRPHVPEDVLRFKEIEKISKKVGFSQVKINFDTSTINRRPLSMVYYSLLNKIKFLQKILPCTTNMYFKK